MSVESEKKQAALAAEARRLGVEEWRLEMAKAVGTDVIRDIVSDARRSNQPASLAKSPEPGSGWVKETPIRGPDGLRYIDQQLDAAAARDRSELRERLKADLERRLRSSE